MLKSEEKELYLDHEESKKLFLVSPDTCYRDLCLLYESSSTDSLDMKLNEFINSCIKLDLDLEGDNETLGLRGGILSEDDNFYRLYMGLLH